MIILSAYFFQEYLPMKLMKLRLINCQKIVFFSRKARARNFAQIRSKLKNKCCNIHNFKLAYKNQDNSKLCLNTV